MLFDGIILTAVHRINKERSVSSIYYLLTGSRNIQTIQDAHIFSNHKFYGIYNSLKKTDFELRIQKLISKGLLIEMVGEKERRVVRCSEKAVNWLIKYKNQLPLHYFAGIKYHEKTEEFYQRLLLLIQTLTNVKEKHFSFIPVITDYKVEQFVRSFYRQIKGNERNYLETLFKELSYILEQLPEKHSEIFVNRLSGYKTYGKSLDQLALSYNMEVCDVQLLLVGIIHRLLSSIEQHPGKFRALQVMTNGLETVVNLNESTKKTYQMFKEGFTPEQIANQRRLKLNTIYDHLAEIALNDPEFPFSSFISNSEANEILQAMKETKSLKLKAIKEKVNPDISFFQIRLMFVYQHKLRKEEDQFVRNGPTGRKT